MDFETVPLRSLYLAAMLPYEMTRRTDNEACIAARKEGMSPACVEDMVSELGL